MQRKHVIGFMVGLTPAVGIAGWLGVTGKIDRTEPEIEWRAPVAETVAGTLSLRFDATDVSPGLASVVARIDDGEPIVVEGTGTHDWDIDTTTLADGEHHVSIEAADASLYDNRARSELTFSVDNTAPTLTLAESSNTVTQGHTLALYVGVDEEVDAVVGQFLDKPRRFYRVGDRVWRALVGVPIRTEAGQQTLTLQSSDKLGNAAKTEATITIVAGEFTAGGYIKLSDSQKKDRKDQAAIDKMRVERDTAYAHDEPEQLWDGPMARPAPGRRSSSFGRYRSYSDGRKSYHSGTDIANLTGTPVLAAGDGKVVHAGWQHIFGNVVIVHHGQGVSTSYNHMSALSVEAGKRVKRGDEVGKIGSTGQSTGPHLHWGMVVDGIAVNAEEWLNDDFSRKPDVIFAVAATE